MTDGKLRKPLVPPEGGVRKAIRHQLAVARRSIDRPESQRGLRAVPTIPEIRVNPSRERKPRLAFRAAITPEAECASIGEWHFDCLLEQPKHIAPEAAGLSVESKEFEKDFHHQTFTTEDPPQRKQCARGIVGGDGVKTYPEIIAALAQANNDAFTRKLLQRVDTPGALRSRLGELGSWNVHNLDLAMIWDEKGRDFVDAVYDDVAARNSPLTGFTEIALFADRFDALKSPERLAHLWDGFARRWPAAGERYYSALESNLVGAAETGDLARTQFYLARLDPHSQSRNAGRKTVLGSALRYACKGRHRHVAEHLAALARTPDEIRLGSHEESLAALTGCVAYFRTIYPPELRRPATPGDGNMAGFSLTSAFIEAARNNQVPLMADIFETTPLDPSRTSFAWSAAALPLKDHPKGEALLFLLDHGWKPDPRDDPALRGALLLDRPEIAQTLWNHGARLSKEAPGELQREIWRTSAENLRAAHKLVGLKEGLAIGVDALCSSEVECGSDKIEVLREIVGMKVDPALRNSRQHILRNAVAGPQLGLAQWALQDLGAKVTAAEIEWACTSANVHLLQLLMGHGTKLEDLYSKDGGTGPATSVLNRTDGHYRPQHVGFLRCLAAQGAWLTPPEAERLKQSPGNAGNEAFVALSEFKGGEVLLENPFRGETIRRGRENVQTWQRRVHRVPPAGLTLKRPYGFRTETFDNVREWVRADMNRGRDNSSNPWKNAPDPEVDAYTYNLTCLFASKDRVLQYLGAHAPNSATPLHDLAQFKLPDEPGWDIKAWGDACLKFGPPMTKYLPYAVRIGAPGTLSETRSRASQFAYKRAAENSTLAAICYELEVTEPDFEAALDLRKEIDPKRASSRVPDITIDGADFEMPGYRWFKAPAGDQRILIAGHFTNCCQAIGEQGEACAKHSAQSSHGSCYFLSKPGKRGEDIVAIGWVWRGVRSEVCLDSFEPIHADFAKKFPLLAKRMGERIERDHPDVPKFTIGTGGRTPRLDYPIVKGKGVPHPREFHGGLRDSKEQYVVFDRQTRDVTTAEINAAELTGAATRGASEPTPANLI